MATTLPPAGSDDVVYVVDLSGYVFRAYHAIQPLSSPGGEPTHATFGTVNMLNKLIADQSPRLVGVAMDSKSPSFRKEIDEAYKANRPPPPEDLSLQMSRCREIVETFGMVVWQQEGIEADDLIASAVRKATSQGCRVVVVSADKDLMQLVGEGVVMWDTMRDKVYGAAEVEAKLGVPPGKVRDLLALMGDTSDNIPGVPGVGAKTAAKLLSEFDNLERILDSVDQIKGKRLQQMLRDRREDALRSQRLVTLRDEVEVAFDREALRYGERLNGDRLIAIYEELGFTRMVETLRQKIVPKAVVKRVVRYSTVLDEEQLRATVNLCREAGAFAIKTETDSQDAMRAHLVGISLSWRPDEAVYVPMEHRYLGAPKQLSLEAVRRELGPILHDDTIRKAGHDLKRDEIVLRRHEFPSFRSLSNDTMIASYLLDAEAVHGLKELARREMGVTMVTCEEVSDRAHGKGHTFDEVSIEEGAACACAGADMTLQLSERLGKRVREQRMQELMDSIELPLSQVLVEMEMTGVLVDMERLAAIGQKMEHDCAELEVKAKQQAGRDFNCNSPRQLETILFDELKLPVTKRTKTGRSTDASVLEALADAHPLVGTILEIRQLTKLKGTYVDALPRLVNPQTGRIHTHFNQVVAATGRLSSSDPNLQNIPIRTSEGRAIREAFVAPPGYVLLSADYSQIELRVLAHLARDPVLIDAFRHHEDVHVRTAMEVFGVGEAEVTAEHRRRAKTINFGVIYGMGEVALAKRLAIPRAEAASFIAKYFERYEGVRRFMDETLETARQTQVVRTMFGRTRHLADMRSANRQLRAQAERMAGNTPIQGTAADLLKLAMVRLREPVAPGARMILTVHDELVFEVPKEHVETATQRVRDAMQSVCELTVPLVVDVGVGDNWAEAH